MELMRQLEKGHRPLWENLKQLSDDMVAASDCDPALLSGWTDRDISLWDVSERDGKPRLQEILIALCRLKKNDWDRISYLRFPEVAVSAAGLSLTATNGKTGVPKVDTSSTHFEIKSITGKGLCTLLFHVSRSEFQVGVFTKREMEAIIFAAYDSSTQHQVAQSATSDTPANVLPASGTEKHEGAPVERLDQTDGETRITNQIQSPNSSTSFE